MRDLLKKSLSLTLAAALMFGSFSFDVKAAEVQEPAAYEVNNMEEATVEEPANDDAKVDATAPTQEDVVENDAPTDAKDPAEEVPSEETTSEDEDAFLADRIPLDEVTEEMTEGDGEWFKYHGYVDQYYDHNASGEMVDENGFVIDELDSNNGTGMPYFNHAIPEKYVGCRMARGIDVSKFQKDINWQQVRASGVEFAFIRVGNRTYGSGDLMEDPYAVQNIQGAQAAGVKVGLYVYSQAINATEAIEEANLAIRYAQTYGVNMPLVMDYEFSDAKDGRLRVAYSNGRLNKDTGTAIASAFCNQVKKAGFLPCIYASKNFLMNQIDGDYLDDYYQIWVAQYLTTYNSTNYANEFRYWQASSNGAVGGVSGNVDLDYWYAPYRTISYQNVSGAKNVNPVRYLEGYGVSGALKPLTHDKWTFGGWYLDAAYKTKITNIDYRASGNLVLYAKWGVFVNLDANGGTINTKRITVEPINEKPFKGFLDDSVTVVKEGNEFLGWYTKDGKLVTAELSSEEFDVETMTELVAHWKVVRLMPNPTASVENNATVEYGTELSLLSEIKNADIYYTMTTDGKEPANPETRTNKEADAKINSVKYEEPIELTANTWIKFIAAKDNYNDSSVVSLKINVNPPVEDPGDVTEDLAELKTENIWTSDIPDQVYTGAAIKPELKVFWNKTLLKEGTDYTVSYKNNVNAGTASVIVKAKGNYTGSFTKYFTITPKDVTSLFKDIKDIAVVYNAKKAQSPAVTILDGKKKLAIKRDYTLTWTNDNGELSKGCTASGDYEITVAGVGNYKGSDTFNFKILDSDQVLMNSVSVSKIANRIYDGTNYEPEITVTYKKEELVAGQDYELSYEDDCASVGAHTITISAKEGSKFFGEKVVKYNVTGIPLSKAKINPNPNKILETYDGAEKKLSGYTVTYAGVDLVENVDYKVSYLEGSNVNAGAKATIIFEGMGIYTGIVKKTYKIAAFNITENAGSKLEVSFNTPGAKTFDRDSFIYVKGGTTPAFTVTYTLYDGTKQTLVSGKDFTFKYANNTAATTQKLIDSKKVPTLIITGKGNFAGSFKKEFAITKSDIADMNFTVSDRLLDAKSANKFAPTITVTETNNAKNPKLAAKTDYVISNYKYAVETEVLVKGKTRTDAVLRKPGEAVGTGDIIQKPTSITVTIEGVNNYEGTYSETYTLFKNNIASATFSIPAQDYTGKEIRLKESQITLKIGKTTLTGQDFDIVSYKNNINKGTATVVIQGCGSYGGTKNLTFKIKEKTVNYTIHYDKNSESATGTMKDSVTASGAKLTNNSFKRTNYTFAGWALDPASKTADYANKAAFYQKGAKFESGSAITLYAVWKPVEYKINYKLNGGINNPANPDTHNIETEVVLLALTKTGYVFSGWYSDARFTTAITKVATTSKAINVYAKFDPDKNANHDLFVAPNGKDENPGTVDLPFKTVQAALNVVKPGQTIYLRKGTYSGINAFVTSGQAGKLITLTSYPNEKVTLTMKSGTDGAPLSLNGQSNIRICNLSIANVSGAAVAGIVLIGEESNVYIENNDIFKIKTTKPKDPEAGGANGILVYGEKLITDIYIDGNLVHNNTNGYSENISICGNVQNVHVTNNKVYANTNIGIDFAGNYGYCSDASADAARDCEAVGNIVYNNKCPYAACAGIYVDGGRNIKILDNTVYGNQLGIEVGSEQWRDSFTAAQRTSDVLIQGNNIYSNLYEGVRIGGYTTDDTTGVVANVSVTGNVLKNNATSIKTDGYEINLLKCDGVNISGNTFYMKKSDFAMINKDIDFVDSLIKNFTFSNNYRNQAKVD